MKRIGFVIAFCLLIGSCGTTEVNDKENKKEDTTSLSTNEALVDTTEEWVEPSYDLSAIQFQSEFDDCLPEPNPEFMKWVKTNSLWEHFPYNYDPIFAYLSTHIDSVSTTIVTDDDPNWGPIAWQQS